MTELTATQAPQTKKYLEDVVLLRLLLIFLLVWNHAFAPFSGKWEALYEPDSVPAYKWFVLAVYHMRIQALIFVSGYLLGYTINRKPERMSFKHCVGKKLKRLWLPSIVFSVIYYVLFYDLTKPIGEIAYSVINGCGHMWFLPMLFWCFAGVYISERFGFKPVVMLMLALLFAIAPWPGLPLRVNNTLNYFIYFYLGYGIQRSYFDSFLPKKQLKPIVAALSVYAGAFVLHYFVLSDAGNILADNQLRGGVIHKAVSIGVNNLCSVAMSLSGLLAVYWGAHYFVVGKHKLPDWMINVSAYCYGVYICQQFILKWMYYNTELPVVCGPYVLPWVALTITLILSLLITHLMLKTRVGRFLIG